MARPAEVFVRPVSMTEGRRLQRIGRTAKDPVRLRRAIVVLMSAQEQSAPDIAHLLDCSPETWKASTDPDFIAKMRRVLDLYDHPPADGRVVCADEFGPLNLQPRPGRAWRPTAHPARLRATYRRTGGVRHMIAALDLPTGQMTYRIRERKRWREFLAFLKLLRSRWPAQKLYLIADNFSPHKHPKVTGWAANNNVELVFLPTYSSWLNWIEPEFTALRYFALSGTDHRTHAWQGEMVDRYMRWRNARAQPKTNFAAESGVRTWTGYQTNAA